MGLVVMKFGGSSVADADKIKHVASHVAAKRRQKNDVVVVVSAPGDMTDDLIVMAQKITDSPDDREMDMLLATGEQVSIALLCMAIKKQGEDAISLTGPQAGIYADVAHTKARITAIKPVKLKQELRKGKIVVVAGFQGLNPNSDITTLGRGGSDLTAVALAAALKAESCEIYTDVPGVFTSDPRVVPLAQKLDKISYDEMLELASAGAQVMQSRSIEVAKNYNVSIHVRSTFLETEGTWIVKEVKGMEKVLVSGVALDTHQAKVSILDVPDEPGVAAKIFTALADQAINVDMIIQSTAQDGKNDISFTVARPDLNKTLSIMEHVKETLKAGGLLSDDLMAKVSVVGVGMRSHSGVAAKMFQTLYKAGINIEMISTSEIKISCAIKQKDGSKAAQALHAAFGLDKSHKVAVKA